MPAPFYDVNPLNEESLRAARYAFELIRGTYRPPVDVFPWDLRLTGKRAEGQGGQTATGGYDRRTGFSQQGLVVTGTAGGSQEGGWLAFEDGPLLNGLALGGGSVLTPTGNATAGYDWLGRPSFAIDDLLTLCGELGWPDAVEVFEQLIVNSTTITIDPDANADWIVAMDVLARGLAEKPRVLGTATGGTTTTLTDSAKTWTVGQHVGAIVQFRSGTGAGQERLVTANTATELTVSQPFDPAPAAGTVYRILPTFTPGITQGERESIKAAGTRLWLDDLSGTLGATLVEERFINAAITIANNVRFKRFGENVDKASTRIGRGVRDITGNVRLEMDRVRADELMNEYERYHKGNDAAISGRRMRLEQTGSEISPGVPKRARIDISRLHWTDFTQDNREGNSTVTLAFRGVVDPSALSVIETLFRSGLAAIAA